MTELIVIISRSILRIKNFKTSSQNQYHTVTETPTVKKDNLYVHSAFGRKLHRDIMNYLLYKFPALAISNGQWLFSPYRLLAKEPKN